MMADLVKHNEHDSSKNCFDQSDGFSKICKCEFVLFSKQKIAVSGKTLWQCLFHCYHIAPTHFVFLNIGLLGTVTESCGGLELTAPPAVGGSNACGILMFYILHVLLPFTVEKGVGKN